MKSIYGLGLFLAGAGIGFAAGNFALKTKYEKRMNDAIDSVKKVYSVKRGHATIVKAPLTAEEYEARKAASTEDPEIAAFNNLKTEHEYTDYTTCVVPAEEVVTLDKSDDGISIVSASEFDIEEGYSNLSLTYYRDGILADEQDVVVEMPDLILGSLTPDELLGSGEHEVFLKNDRQKAYIEIVKDDLLYYGDVVPDGEGEF